MSKLTDTEKKIIIGIILIILIVGLGSSIMVPLTGTIRINYQNYLDKNAESQALEEKIADLKELKKIEDDIVKTDADFLEFIPNDSEDEDVMVSLNALAIETGNSLPNFSIETSKDNDGGETSQFGKRILTLGLDGTLESIMQFIEKAQTLKRYNKITSISISQKQDVGLQANITMEIYYKITK